LFGALMLGASQHEESDPDGGYSAEGFAVWYGAAVLASTFQISYHVR
jgi:hypothetical protein